MIVLIFSIFVALCVLFGLIYSGFKFKNGNNFYIPRWWED